MEGEALLSVYLLVFSAQGASGSVTEGLFVLTVVAPQPMPRGGGGVEPQKEVGGGRGFV